jgi:hypothetical protein
MNLQVISSPDGTIVWVSNSLPGATHDLTAARIWGLIRRLATAGLLVLADKGYQGAGEPLITPYKGRAKPEPKKDANRSHARLRGPGERANAQLKSWKMLRKLRCCPHRARPHRSSHPHPSNPRNRQVLKGCSSCGGSV